MGGKVNQLGYVAPPPVNERISRNGFLYTSRQYLYFVKHLYLLEQLTAITKSIASHCSKIMGGGGGVR